MREVKNDGQPTPLNAPILKRRTACDGEFNTYAGERDDTAILNVSPQFVRVAMQQGKLPIGTAVQMSSIWTYHISEKLLADYSGKNIEKEIERIRGGVENDEK